MALNALDKALEEEESTGCFSSGSHQSNYNDQLNYNVQISNNKKKEHVSTVEDSNWVYIEKENDQTQSTPISSKSLDLDDDVPAYLCCPITQEIMKEPVLLVETGQTYEKSVIEEWLKNHDTCPITGVVLKSKATVVVYALKQAIAEWKAKHKKI